MFKIFISVCFVASALGATIPKDPWTIYMDSPIHGYIVGGRDTDISEVPYQVAMYLGNGYRCGASIVSPTHVVTASHCVVGTKHSAITFRVGSSDKAGGVVVKNKKVYEHPKFNMSVIDYDVAVVELETPLNFSKTIKPIKLASKEPKPGSNTTVSGWGRLQENGGVPKTLQSVVVPVVDRKICNDAYYSEYKMKINQRMICAGVKGKDACQGDSGGPLASNGELVGIVSFGAGCGRDGFPGVYTNVADPEITKFIKDIVKT